MAKRKKVVILGGGFAGLMTARHLVKNGATKQLCEITVIDLNDAHVYTPWLYEAATGALRGETEVMKKKMIDMAAFHYDTLPGFKDVRFLKQKIVSIDFAGHYVELEGKRKVPYDALVMALGAEPNYFGIPGLPENALTLKRLADAEQIHDAITRLMDKATAAHPKYITIAGAGPNGIEFVSELANTIKILERHEKIQPQAIKITLIDTATELFTILPPQLRKKATRRVEALGVEFRSGLRVSEVNKGSLKAFTQSGRAEDQVQIPADICIWSGGVKVNSMVTSLPLLKDDRGRLVVEDSYMVASHPGVFAAGDCAALINPHTGKADPQSAQVAHYQAHGLAANVVRFLKGEVLKSASLPKRWAFFSALGGAYAAGVLGGIRYSGYPAFLLRRFSDLYYFFYLLPFFSALSFWIKGVNLYRKNDI